jgi:hypothetical protein
MAESGLIDTHPLDRERDVKRGLCDPMLEDRADVAPRRWPAGGPRERSSEGGNRH